MMIYCTPRKTQPIFYNNCKLRITFKNCESLNCNIYKVVLQLYVNKNKIKSFFSEKSPHIMYEISYIKYHTIHIVLQLKIFFIFLFFILKIVYECCPCYYQQSYFTHFSPNFVAITNLFLEVVTIIFPTEGYAYSHFLTILLWQTLLVYLISICHFLLLTEGRFFSVLICPASKTTFPSLLC